MQYFFYKCLKLGRTNKLNSFIYFQILQTGQEINEIDNTGFATDGPTVFAGNLGNNKYIVQITTVAVRLLAGNFFSFLPIGFQLITVFCYLGTNQLQHVPLDLGSPIVHVSCTDPYVSLLTTDGQVITLMLRETRGTAKLVISKSTLSNVSWIVECLNKILTI